MDKKTSNAAANSSRRDNRPGSVAMPSPPFHPQRNTSPSLRGEKPTTPTGNGGESSNLSPSLSGPLSPSNHGSSSFIFPIRSVFHGMNQSDEGGSSSNNSRSGRNGNNGTNGNNGNNFSNNHGNFSPNDRRRSMAADGMMGGMAGEDVVGISTIAQMLEEGMDAPMRRDDDRTKSTPGTATFTGTKEKKARDAPPGSFSAPLATGNESPFFSTSTEPRRASEPESTPDTSKGDQPHRPEMPDKDDSANTLRGPEKNLPVNPSAEAEGSGLTDKTRPPVGQPQEAPTGINYRDRPGETTGDQQSYSQPYQHQEAARGAAKDDSDDESKEHPTPLRPVSSNRTKGSDQPQQPGMSRKPSSTQSQNSSTTNIEMDENGQPSIVPDYSGIVRLADPGPHSSGYGTGDSGTGSRGVNSGSIPSGPTNARLAHQQRQSRSSNTQDSVRNFINAQAHTENLTDPNAPTPSPHSPAPPPRDDEEMGPEVPPREWAERSETSLSVRDSSEVATAASVDQAEANSEPEEPIVTFRFEHVATDDGHHVVVGREGLLQRCEDEPITTPGAVQGFGVLVVLEENEETGDLLVRQVSENSTELLGLSPRYLFRLECFTRVLTDEQEDLLRDNIEYLPSATSGKGSVEEEGPQVFLLSGFGEPGSDDVDEDQSMSSAGAGRRREWTCWVAAHRPKQPTWDKVDSDGKPIPAPELIVLEFELERDQYNPLMQTHESSYGGTPGSVDSSTTVSAGSRGHTSGSTDSAGPSDLSTTTVGSTPRPSLVPHGESGGTTETVTSGSTSRPDTHPSSKLPRGMQPMGLEGIDVELPLDRIIESTTNHAKPLRALERMRRTGMSGDDQSSSGRASARSRPARRRPAGSSTGTMDVFAVLGQINEQLGSAPDLEQFLKICVGVIQDLCRFHRVLIYQFDEAYNGQVVAELVEWGKTTDLFKGLMFPAADIPAQARQLYMINKVRLLYDRSQTTARMVLRSRDDLDNPLDMTHCYLRAMSPIHIKYLANMHVRSSMSVSIMAFGQLWGLIACHSYGHHGMRVSFPVRQMMRILSDSISRNIERLSYAQRLHTRKLISTIPSTHHPTGYIVSNANDLLQIFDADSGLLVIGDGCKLLGSNEQGTAMLAIAEYLRIMRFDTLKASNHLARDFPDLVLPRAQDTIAGLLYVPLTAKAGQDFIVFLRKGQVREVQWAGKPYKDETSGDKASLEPRKSFKTWSETVTGRSRSWSDDQMESAGVLALIYGKFIQVWREKQSAMASNQLTAILLSNTSHAVRTPLSQIINTLELALSGDIDPDTRSMLENSHQASRALLFHVHDLLDLTRIETGNETAFSDPFDIRQSITDSVRPYQTEAARRGLEFRVNVSEQVPQYLIGDSRKIKTVISNLVANAIKFTEQGYVEVYCGLQQEGEGQEVVRNGNVGIEIVISDSGCGIPTDQLEAMFITLEGAEEARPPEQTGLGLGLAVVARIVEQLSGQLRADSEVGAGSRFYFTLQMLVSANKYLDESEKSLIRQRQSSGSDSLRSRSNSSHGHSEIDSFVQDFASSHMLAPVSADDKRIKDAEVRMSRPGTFPVTDSSYPVRPSRVDTELSDEQSPPPTSNARMLEQSSPKVRPQASFNRGVSYSRPPKRISMSSSSSTGSLDSPAPPTLHRRGSNQDGKLRVLVVEDDAINSQILQKRLRMDKHTAIPVTNGQEAVDFLRGDWDIDVVLMDIQMPIMDGRTAAKEIRALEAKTTLPDDISPLRVDNRIPIFAVSASLYESDRLDLAEHFDGWLLKPLDFNRVRAIFKAILDPKLRSKEVYVQGNWEKGGFLRDAKSPASSTTPSSKAQARMQD